MADLFAPDENERNVDRRTDQQGVWSSNRSRVGAIQHDNAEFKEEFLMQYQTQDSRLAAYLLTNGIPLFGTEVRYQEEDDRVLLTFTIEDQDQFSQLKRDFFENGKVPALLFANNLKFVMHAIREARELARTAR